MALVWRLFLGLCVCLPLLTTHTPAQHITQKTEHATFRIYSELSASDNRLTILIDLTPEENWHTYWVNPGDSGLGLSVDWQLPEGAKVLSHQFPAPERIQFGPLTNYGYHDSMKSIVDIDLPTPIATSSDVHISGTAHWLVCKDVCIPESATFSITLPTNTTPHRHTHRDLIRKARDAIPKKAPFNIDTIVSANTLTLAWDDSTITTAYFFPEEQGIISASDEQSFNTENSISTLRIPLVSSLPSTLNGIISVRTIDGHDHAYSFQHHHQPHSSQDIPLTVGIAVLFAFIGGLLLNIMPCVFPVLSLKILSLSKQRSQKDARLSAFYYTAGILLSMSVMFAAVLALKIAGERVGWGFHLQSPVVVTLLLYLMLYLGFYLLGLMPLPMSLYSLSGRVAKHDTPHRSSAWSSFMTGVLAVIVATPCTAPFMAPAIGAAFTLPGYMGALIFVSLGFGLAFPFLLLSMIPSLSTKLPKPGKWMETFKELMAFPMFLTAIWLLWVLMQQVSTNSIVMIVLGITFLGFLAWLYKNTHLSERLILILFILAIGLSSVAISPNLPTNIPSDVATPSHITKAIQNGERVFVNVTAAWCITCQVNKQRVLGQADIQQFFNDNHVRYIELDWTNKNDTITTYLSSFNRQGVPLYIYYNSEGHPQILPQLLTKQIIKDAITP